MIIDVRGRLVVLEGPDGSGKTSLSLRIKEDLTRTWYGAEGPCRSRADYDRRLSFMRHLALHDRRGVMDRAACISQPIYDRALGRPALSTIEDSFTYLQELRQHIHIVLCLPTIALLRDGLEEQLALVKAHKPPEHSDKVRKNFNAIYSGYDTWRMIAKTRRLPFTIYDRGKYSLDAFMRYFLDTGA